MMMKREREVEIITMANYLMLLSGGGGELEKSSSKNHRVFECKTCNRRFQSFQALGGHRASHKKPRLMEGSDNQMVNSHDSPLKAKTHECSICGLEFAIGQALGGHMRRHRAISGSSSGNMQSVSNSSKSVLFNIDLNLTPFENDLQVLKISSQESTRPLVDCFN